MANYHTASDCGCSQNTSQCPMPEKPCPADTPGRQMMQRPCPADMPGRQMMQRPCSADMPGRQMMQRPCPADMPRRQMMQKPCPSDMSGRQTMQKPCPADMSGRQTMQKSCPADMPHPKMPDCPSMPGNCHGGSDPLSGMPIAMAYVPWQFFNETFDVDKALQCGTIFPELSKPFLGKGGCPK